MQRQSSPGSTPRRTRGQWPARTAALFAALLLGGCASSLLQQPVADPDHRYFLDWAEDAAAPRGPRKGPDLLISPMLAAPGFDGSDMAYVRKPHEIAYFARHHWVDAPARMLDPLLVRAADQSGLFRSVVESGSGTQADLRLDSRLLHLQQVCRPEPGEVQLALRLTLIDITSGRTLGERPLGVNEPLEGCTPYAGVQAANRALARLMSDLQAFLAAHVK